MDKKLVGRTKPESCGKQSVSRHGPMLSGVPQKPVCGLVLFSIFINDTNSEIKCTLSKFADDTRLKGAVDKTKGQDVNHRDLEKPERWASGNHTT